MAYTPTNWINDETYVDEDNMNHIEQGIKDNDDKLQGLTPMGDIVVDSIRSKNMFNTNTILLGYYYNDEGTLTSSDANALSDFIEVKNDNSYTISCTTTAFALDIVEFDSSKGFIRRNTIRDTNEGTITTSSTTKYIRCTYNKDNSTTMTKNLINNSNIQLEESSTATTYSSYQNLDNQEIYSTDEVRIGTWVDNKPIYRKVAFIENPIVDSEEHRVSLGLTNPEQITRLDAYYNVSVPKQTTPLNTHNFAYNQSSYYKYNYEWNDFVYASNTSLGTIIVIVEYTKTTD